MPLFIVSSDFTFVGPQSIMDPGPGPPGPVGEWALIRIKWAEADPDPWLPLCSIMSSPSPCFLFSNMGMIIIFLLRLP